MKRRLKSIPLLSFEHIGEPLAPVHVFRRRMLRNGGVTLGVIAFSLLLGMAGYHWFGGIESWVDCLYNASMILGGMGPVADLKSDTAKVFASFYALFSGVVFISSVAVFLGPIVHRFLHNFHFELYGSADDRDERK